MLITCTNKGCLKTSNALLDEETSEVVCQECGQPIENIAESMRRTLKSFGQVVRTNERKAFTMACRACRANREVALNEDNETVCKICHEPITITPTFKMAMEATGTKLARIETKKITKKTKKKVNRKKAE